MYSSTCGGVYSATRSSWHTLTSPSPSHGIITTQQGVLCEDIKTHIDEYSAPQLVDLLWGLSKLRYADGHLYLLAAREILLDLHALQARHLADLLFSFAAVNCRPGERLLDAIQVHCGGYNVGACRQTCKTCTIVPSGGHTTSHSSTSPGTCNCIAAWYDCKRVVQYPVGIVGHGSHVKLHMAPCDTMA